MSLRGVLAHTYVSILARGLLAVVFLVAGTGTLRHHRRFVATVLAYKVLPKRPALAFARLLPWLEVIVGGLLLAGVAIRTAALLSAALLLSFLFGIGLNLWRGRRDLECGCFARRQKIGRRILFRNTVLFLLALQVAAFDDGSLTLQHWLSSVKPLRWELVPEARVLLVLTAVGVWTIGRLVKQLVHFATRERRA